jgi:hypothetical protein
VSSAGGFGRDLAVTVKVKVEGEIEPQASVLPGGTESQPTEPKPEKT